MRKPAPENLNVASQQHSHADHSTVGADGTPHVHQAHATHAHDASLSAGAYGGVIAGEISADADVHGDDSSGMSAGSVVMGVAAAPSLSSSLQQLNEQREERTKKSVAYRHTGFHRLMLDNFGKEYEKRICSYCTAVFSFKGGTTSAALRHLKTSHPERLMYSGVSMPMPQQQQQLQLQQQLQEQQPQPQHQLQELPSQPQQDEPLDQEQQQQQQHYGGGIEEPVAHDEAVREAEIAQDQHSSVEEQVEQQETESEPDQTTSLDAEQGFESGGGGDSSGGAVPPQYADPPPVALHESGEEIVAVAVAVADGSTEQEDAKEDDGEVLSHDMQMRPQTKAQQQVKRKRQQRDDAESGRSGGGGGGGGDHSSHSFGAGGKYAPPLTASQSAITHFLHHYKEMLSLPNRLRFVKHLTHHPSEAEMYNVLDEATQMEYVREFSDDATTI